MSNDLTPCPWCGNAPRLEKEEIHFPNSKNNLWAITCDTDDCPAGNIAQDGEMGGFRYSWPKDEAIERWNRRAPPNTTLDPTETESVNNNAHGASGVEDEARSA